MGTSSVTVPGASGAPDVSARSAAVPAAGRVPAAAALAAIMAAAHPAGAEPDTAAPPAHETPAPGQPPSGAGGAPNHENATPPSPPPHPDQAARAETGYRFAFHPSGDGYLRLDRATGVLAVCTPQGTTWNCAAGHDDRAALDSEIARLQRDNAALKNALLEHGVALPAGIAPAPSSQGDDDANKSTTEADQAIPRPPQTVPPTPGMVPAPGERRVMDAITRTWRRLVAIMSDLRRELQ